MSSDRSLVAPFDGRFVPRLRSDLARCTIDAEAVIWSPGSAQPVALDPVSTVMLSAIDGEASIDELVDDVHDIVGVPRDVAAAQVARVVTILDQARALVSSADDPSAHLQRELFTNPPST